MASARRPADSFAPTSPSVGLWKFNHLRYGFRENLAKQSSCKSRDTGLLRPATLRSRLKARSLRFRLRDLDDRQPFFVFSLLFLCVLCVQLLAAACLRTGLSPSRSRRKGAHYMQAEGILVQRRQTDGPLHAAGLSCSFKSWSGCHDPLSRCFGCRLPKMPDLLGVPGQVHHWRSAIEIR